MLHRNMDAQEKLKLALEDVLADLWHARRSGDIGRLALLIFCDVRRWARVAHEDALAEQSSKLVMSCPHVSRQDFLFEVEDLIGQMEYAHAQLAQRNPQERVMSKCLAD